MVAKKLFASWVLNFRACVVPQNPYPHLRGNWNSERVVGSKAQEILEMRGGGGGGGGGCCQ